MTTRRLQSGVLGVALVGACAPAQEPKPPSGRVHGEGFMVDNGGGRSPVPGVKVSLDGASPIDVQSGNRGNFTFDPVTPGNYAIVAQPPGMATSQSIQVSAFKSFGYTLIPLKETNRLP